MYFACPLPNGASATFVQSLWMIEMLKDLLEEEEIKHCHHSYVKWSNHNAKSGKANLCDFRYTI